MQSDAFCVGFSKTCLVDPMNTHTVEKRHFIWQQRCNNQYTAGFYSPVPEVIWTVALGLFFVQLCCINTEHNLQYTRDTSTLLCNIA